MLGKLLSRLIRAKEAPAQPPPIETPLSYQLDCFPDCLPVFRGGRGLEIGGPSALFTGEIPVYHVAECLDNCNFGGTTVWEGEIAEGDTFDFRADREPGRQFISEASELPGIADGSYDYLLSSHCLEHLANPLKGLAEWRRVLKPEGLLVLALPHKDATFDHRRPVTQLSHMIEDFSAGMGEDDLTHLPEILALHDLDRDPEAGGLEAFKARSLRNVENRCLHQHVFDTRLAVQMVGHMGFQVAAVQPMLPLHIIVIARKTDAAIDNSAYLGATPCWTSPFPSDGRPA